MRGGRHYTTVGIQLVYGKIKQRGCTLADIINFQTYLCDSINNCSYQDRTAETGIFSHNHSLSFKKFSNGSADLKSSFLVYLFRINPPHIIGFEYITHTKII